MENRELEAELSRLVADFRPAADVSRDYSMRGRGEDPMQPVFRDTDFREPAGIVPAEPRPWIGAAVVAAALVAGTGYWLIASPSSQPATALPGQVAAAPLPERVIAPSPMAAAIPDLINKPQAANTQIASAAPVLSNVPLPRARPKMLR